MIYTFDKKQNILRFLDEDKFLTAELTFKINEATTFSFTVTPDYELTDEEKYVALPHPLDNTKFIMLRLISRTDNKDDIEYTAYEYSYQELSTSGYIKDTRPRNADALTLMTKALEGSGWSVGRTTVAGTATTNFYYIDYLSAISKVVDLLGGEIVFYVEITGNKITGRYMDYLFRQGVDTSKVFANGSNLLTVARKKQSDSIYTAILPRGKGEQVSDGGGNEPDGYGRRIDIKDVVWSTAKGNPLNKPAGSFILEDPQSTAEYGQVNGNARLLIKNFDEVDDPNVLIQQAYNMLMTMNHPLIEYSATVSDVGTLSLGDTVLIMHGQRNLSYKTRVFQVKYDLLHSENTELSLGDNLSSNNITSQINDIRSSIQTNSNQQAWTVSQFGRPSTTFGAEQPSDPKVGDVWFKSLPDGNVEIWRYNGTIWVKLITPTTGEDIAKAVDDAVAQANAHTATAIEENNASQQKVMSDVAKSQADLAIKDGDFNNKAQAMADRALSDAKANTDTVAQETLDTANQNIATAKSDLTEGLQKEVSDRNSAVSALDTKAQGYVDAAKSDINDTINALSIGGRNYLLNSNGSTLDKWTPVNGWSIISDADRGNAFTFTPTTNWTGGSTNSLSQTRTDFPTNKTVTASFLAKASVDGAKFHSEPSGGNSAENSSFNIALTTTWKRYSYTFVLKTNTVYFMPVDAGTIYYLDDLQLETGNMMSDYKQAPEDVVLDYTTKDNKIKETITQYKETNDGLVSKAQTDATTALGLVETKISLTDYNTKTGELSKKINDTKDTADRSAQTIADIQEADGKRDSRISEVEKTAGEIKSTVSDLSDEQGKQSGDISTLQQRADGFDATVTKVDNLGQINQLFNTEFTPDFAGWINGNIAPFVVDGSYNGSIRVRNTATVSGNRLYSGLISVQGVSVVSTSVYNGSWSFVRGYDKNKNPIGELKSNLVSSQGLNVMNGISIPSTVYYIDFGVQSDINSYISQPMLVFASTIGTYVQGNYNNNSATAKAQLTADNAALAVTKLTSADGIITKTQADIRANSDAITKTVSKTVYDQKTGELNQAISKAQSTADGAVSTVGNYQTSNDKRVKAAESAISQNADAIALKVAKTDYDNNNSQLNTRFTKVEATADGTSTTVGNLQTAVNNLGQINQLFNTEFSPDFSGWYNKYPNPLLSNTVTTELTKVGTDGGGSTVVSHKGGGAWVSNGPIAITQGTPVSISARVSVPKAVTTGLPLALYVMAFDSGGNRILAQGYDIPINQLTSTPTTFKKENIVMPSNATQVYYVWGWGTDDEVYISQPMMVFSDHVGTYVQGNYNNNAALAQVKITADGVSSIVSDPTTGLSTRVQTAEGTLNTVKSTADGAMSKAIQTANNITQEISDRNDGDSNTLQSAKSFTQSSISSSEEGMKSTITQTSNAVIAQIGNTNLITNSEFDPTNVGWYSMTNSIGSSIGSLWNVPITGGFSEQPEVGGSRLALYNVGTWFTSELRSSSAGKIYSASIVAGRANPASTSTALDLRIAFWDSNKKLLLTYSSGNIIDGTAYKNIKKYTIENKVAPTGTSFVSIIIGHSSGGVNDVIGRPMLNTGLLASTYKPTTSTSSSSTILSLFKDNWSIGINDNIGAITSGIVANSDSISLINKNIVLDGNTTVTGDFYAKGGNFKNLNASNLTVGTLNGSQVNITNINANNIVSGSISGANLNINLNTGSVVFQKGRINSSDYTTDINIDQGYISTANGDTRALLTQGKLQLIDPTLFSPQTNPYLEISNRSGLFNGMAALVKARDSLTVSINGYDQRGFNLPPNEEEFVGLSIGKNSNELMATKIGGAEQGVIISGGKRFTVESIGYTPYIYVGSDSSGRSPNGDRVSIHASYFHSPSTYIRTTSGSANVVVNLDGALVRSSSARKYKLDIKNNIPIADSLKLIEVPLSTWVDKHEHEENGSNERYFGMIAEDLRDAGLEYLVQYGENNEVEGINYDRVALLLIPLVKELKERIEELESKGK